MILYSSCPDSSPSGLSITPKQSGPHPLQRPVHWCIHDICACSVLNLKIQTCNLNYKYISTKNIKKQRFTHQNSNYLSMKKSTYTFSMAISLLLPLQDASSWVSSQTTKPWESGSECSDIWMDRWIDGALDRCVAFHRFLFRMDPLEPKTGCFGWILWCGGMLRDMVISEERKVEYIYIHKYVNI